MAIQFRDFFPEIKSRGVFKNEYATLQETVAQASAWIAKAKVQVLNVETVLLPNVSNEEETATTGIRTSGDMSSWWYQVIRVWYLE